MPIRQFVPPAFGAHFWQPYAPRTSTREDTGAVEATGAAGAAVALEAAGTAVVAPLSYSPERHGAHADFCLSPAFWQYRAQVQANLRFLAEYCHAHKAQDGLRIVENLETFFRHRFDDHHYFDTRAELVDSVGKQSLDAFCGMIRHVRMDPAAKVAAIRDLAIGITQCADGAVANLAGAARKLAKTVGGVRGQLWTLKEEVARDALREVAQAQFGHIENYGGNEIHYVSTALNRLAPRYGFEQAPDGIRMREAEHHRFLVACEARLKSVLTPDRLALHMAQSCLACFKSEGPAAALPATGAWTAGIQAQCTAKLREIGDDLGLLCEDDLRQDPHTGSWRLHESELRLKSFLELKEEGDTWTYKFRSDPTLIALDLLRAMARMDLIQDGSRPWSHGSVPGPDGTRTTLFVYGELAWLASTSAHEDADVALWDNKNAEIEPATVPGLLQWQASQPSRLPEAVVAQAIRVTDDARLTDIPGQWVHHLASVEALLGRLGKTRGVAYLTANADALADGFPDRKRQQLLDCALRMGMGEAIPAMVGRWFTSAEKRVDMVYRLLRHDALPGLHYAMQQADPKTAVLAWYAPIRQAGLFPLIAARVPALLDVRYLGYTLLGRTMGHGNPSAVDAFFLLLRDVLSHRRIQPHFKETLPDLLAASDSLQATALCFAMARGELAVVQAFYAGLKDLLSDAALAGPIRPALLRALPDLLVGKKNGFDSGLAYALGNGHTPVVQAFHGMLQHLLADPFTAVHLWPALPDMLAERDGDGKLGVDFAHDHGHLGTLAAFNAVLADPLVRPHIEAGLFDRLATRLSPGGG